MIVSFGDAVTADLFHNRPTRRVQQVPPTIRRRTLYKLDVINGAHHLRDLRSPPGNRLERLRGKLDGYYSIRVNDQWRIVFLWENGNAFDVALADYHK